MKTVFITGAEGFTGKHLVEHLRKKGYDVVCGVRNRARKLSAEKQYGRAIVCDVSDAINVARAVASVRPDSVIHLAGVAQSYIAAEEPLTAYQSIVTGWANVLDAARRSVPRARIVLASSCEVYGSAGDNGQPTPETTACQPTSTFGSLKAAAESIAHTFFQAYHLNVTIARPFHCVGLNQPETSFFGSVARQLCEWDFAAKGSNFPLTDLNCRRDVLHIQDVVEAYTLLLEDGRPNETYNICSGRTWTVRQICETFARLTNQNVQFTDASGDSNGRVNTFCGSNAKMNQQFGWQPGGSVDSALADVIRTYQTQRSTQRTTAVA